MNNESTNKLNPIQEKCKKEFIDFLALMIQKYQKKLTRRKQIN